MFLILTHISVGCITRSFFSSVFSQSYQPGTEGNDVNCSEVCSSVHHFDSGGYISVKFALNIYRSWRMMTPDLFQPLSGRNITTGKISYSVREILVQNAEHIHNPTGTCPLDCNGPTTFQSCKILCDTRIYFTQTGFPGWYFIFSLIMWQCTRITTASFKALARKTESAQSTP